MIRLHSLLLSCALAFALVPAATPHAQAQAPAAAYAVVDDDRGVVLESANPAKKLQVGSLTKIATAMVVLDWAKAQNQDLAQLAPVSNTAAALNTQGGVGLQAGDRVSLKELLYAALMQSDNTAAQALGEFVGAQLGGGEAPEKAFVEQMNALANQLGMSRTQFANPTGLDEGVKPLPYSTAADLAKLTRYAMSQSGFRFYVSQAERKISIVRPDGTTAGYLLRNTNEALGKDGIDGVKTGTTRKAGACLIISAGKPPESRQEGTKFFITPRRLTVVVLNAPNRFEMARGLLAQGWAQHEKWAAAGRPKEWKER